MKALHHDSTTENRLASQIGRVLREEVEAGCLTAQTEPLAEILESRIIGQEGVTDSLTCAFPRVIAGLRDPGRPVLSLLLLGPTDVGKTETARAIAQTLFGSEQAMARVNCEVRPRPRAREAPRSASGLRRPQHRAPPQPEAH